MRLLLEKQNLKKQLYLYNNINLKKYAILIVTKTWRITKIYLHLLR